MQYDFILTTGKCHVKSRDTQGEQQPADVRGKCWKDTAEIPNNGWMVCSARREKDAKKDSIESCRRNVALGSPGP